MNEWIKFGGNFSRNVIPNCAVSMIRNDNGEVSFFHSGNEVSSEQAMEIMNQYNQDLIAGTFQQEVLKTASEEFDAFCLELEGAKFTTIAMTNFDGGVCGCCGFIEPTQKIVAYRKLQ